MTDTLLFLWASELMLQLDSSTVLTITRISISHNTPNYKHPVYYDSFGFPDLLLFSCFLVAILDRYSHDTWQCLLCIFLEPFKVLFSEVLVSGYMILRRGIIDSYGDVGRRSSTLKAPSVPKPYGRTRSPATSRLPPREDLFSPASKLTEC